MMCSAGCTSIARDEWLRVAVSGDLMFSLVSGRPWHNALSLCFQRGQFSMGSRTSRMDTVAQTVDDVAAAAAKDEE